MDTGKIQHETEDAARDHIRVLYKAGKGNPDYNVYRCLSCGTWHVGHSRKKLDDRIKRTLRRRPRGGKRKR